MFIIVVIVILDRLYGYYDGKKLYTQHTLNTLFNIIMTDI